jgi:hypothetical protein
MKEAKDMLRIAVIIVLSLFVLIVGGSLALTAVGIIIGILSGLAVFLIKLAVVVAIGYLILVGVRALLR